MKTILISCLCIIINYSFSQNDSVLKQDNIINNMIYAGHSLSEYDRCEVWNYMQKIEKNETLYGEIILKSKSFKSDTLTEESKDEIFSYIDYIFCGNFLLQVDIFSSYSHIISISDYFINEIGINKSLIKTHIQSSIRKTKIIVTFVKIPQRLGNSTPY